jgi:hypothetical protein
VPLVVLPGSSNLRYQMDTLKEGFHVSLLVSVPSANVSERPAAYISCCEERSRRLLREIHICSTDYNCCLPKDLHIKLHMQILNNRDFLGKYTKTSVVRNVKSCCLKALLTFRRQPPLLNSRPNDTLVLIPLEYEIVHTWGHKF